MWAGKMFFMVVFYLKELFLCCIHNSDTQSIHNCCEVMRILQLLVQKVVLVGKEGYKISSTYVSV